MRTISSAWSAAVLAAVVLTTVSSAAPIIIPEGATIFADGDMPQRTSVLLYVRALICLIGSAGILALWYIDQRVYQKLLHTVFSYGLYLELTLQYLPQIRTSLFLANHDIANRLGWFYRVQFLVFPITGLIIVLSNREPSSGHWIVIGGHVAVAFAMLVWTYSWKSLQRVTFDLFPGLKAAWPSVSGRQAWLTRIASSPLGGPSGALSTRAGPPSDQKG